MIASALASIWNLLFVLVGIFSGWAAWYALIDRDGEPLTKHRAAFGFAAGAVALYVALIVWNDLPESVEECWWEDRTYVCR